MPLSFLLRNHSCPSNEKQAEQVESDCTNDNCGADEVTVGLRRALLEAISCLRSEQQKSRKEPDQKGPEAALKGKTLSCGPVSVSVTHCNMLAASIMAGMGGKLSLAR